MIRIVEDISKDTDLKFKIYNLLSDFYFKNKDKCSSNDFKKAIELFLSRFFNNEPIFENLDNLKESEELYKLPDGVQILFLSDFNSEKIIRSADGTDCIQWEVEDLIWNAVNAIDVDKEEIILHISKRNKTPIDDEGNIL